MDKIKLQLRQVRRQRRAEKARMRWNAWLIRKHTGLFMTKAIKKVAPVIIEVKKSLWQRIVAFLKGKFPLWQKLAHN